MSRLRRTPIRRSGRLAPISKKQRRRQVRFANVKAEVLDRDEHTCQRCYGPAADVHHMRGRVGGDLTDKDLLVSLCRLCHGWVEEHPLAARAEGFSVRRVR